MHLRGSANKDAGAQNNRGHRRDGSRFDERGKNMSQDFLKPSF